MKRNFPDVYDLFNPPFDPGISNNEPSLTRQAHKDECDINFLMDRYERTGLFYDPAEQGTRVSPQFGDFNGFDYIEAMNAVVEANDRFSALPARLRARFENDPAQLLFFLEDEKNRDEAISLGLLNKPAEPAPSVPPAQ